MAIGNQHRQIGSLPNRLTSYATVDTRVARQTAVHNNMERTRISIDEPLPPLHRHPAGRSARLRAASLFVRRHTPNHRLPEPIRARLRGCHEPTGLPAESAGRPPTGTCSRGNVCPACKGDECPFAERVVNAGGCVVL